ncbi:MAG: family 16 glycoside hydrolase [Planctomycetota bacterium]
MQRAITCIILAALALLTIATAAQAAAIESKIEGGVLTASVGKAQATYDVGKGTASVRWVGAVLAGKGVVLKLTPDGARFAVADLTADVKAGKVPQFGPFDWLAARVELQEGVCCIALINPGGGGTLYGAPLGKLGLAANAAYVGYDLTGNHFIGPIRRTLWRTVNPGACSLVALAPAGDRPVLLCTSQVLAGKPDTENIRWDANAGVLAGATAVAANKTCHLRIFAPPQPDQRVAESASLADEDIKAGATAEVMQTGEWLAVLVKSPTDRQVKWQIKFAKRPAGKAAEVKATVAARAISPRWVRINCYTTGGDVILRRSDGPEFFLKGACLDDTTVSPGTAYTYSIIPVSWSGEAKAVASVEVKSGDLPPLPPRPDVYLSDLRPVKATNGWNGEPRRDTSIEDNPIRLRNEIFKRGMGVHAVSELVYDLAPQFKRFVAVIGVDDEKDSGSVTFDVYADGKALFQSGVVKRADEWKCINVEIPKGAKQLRLVVGDGGDGVGCDHADWAEAGFLTLGDKYVPPPPPVEQGFEQIFNGKDLTGWDGDPQFWSAKDGAIRGETTEQKALKQNTFLIWRGGKLRDFVLKIKFRLRNHNSGIQYRSQDLGNWSVAGYQADILENLGMVGFLYHERGRGMLVNLGDFTLVNDKSEKKVVGRVSDPKALAKAGFYKPQDWNEFIIAARGNHITHVLNGYPTIELIDEDKEDPKGSAREGILALQLHQGPPMLVEFKNILLKRLDADYGKTIRLFNGENLDGWTFSSEAVKPAWGVKDGVMTNQGKPAGYIRTTADHTNFTLSLQTRHITKGNSGVLVRMTGEDKVWPRSIEAQGMFGNMGDIFNIGEFPMKTDPTRTKGRHTAKMHPSNERPLGEWNTYEITLNGGDLEIKVNDLLQNAATDCEVIPGKICIQSEGAQMEYRNVVLVPIAPKKK